MPEDDTNTAPPDTGALRLGEIQDDELQLLDYFASAARTDDLLIKQDPAACAALVGVSADDYSDAFYAQLAREKYRYAIAMIGARRRLHEQIAEDAKRMLAANDAEAAPASAAATEH